MARPSDTRQRNVLSLSREVHDMTDDAKQYPRVQATGRANDLIPFAQQQIGDVDQTLITLPPHRQQGMRDLVSADARENMLTPRRSS